MMDEIRCAQDHQWPGIVVRSATSAYTSSTPPPHKSSPHDSQTKPSASGVGKRGLTNPMSYNASPRWTGKVLRWDAPVHPGSIPLPSPFESPPRATPAKPTAPRLGKMGMAHRMRCAQGPRMPSKVAQSGACPYTPHCSSPIKSSSRGIQAKPTTPGLDNVGMTDRMSCAQGA